MRRVGRVEAVRAEPMGALLSRDDTPVTEFERPAEPTEPAEPGEPAGDEPEPVGASLIGDAPAGAPQTLQ
jgi:hypothetical protein